MCPTSCLSWGSGLQLRPCGVGRERERLCQFLDTLPGAKSTGEQVKPLLMPSALSHGSKTCRQLGPGSRSLILARAAAGASREILAPLKSLGKTLITSAGATLLLPSLLVLLTQG